MIKRWLAKVRRMVLPTLLIAPLGTLAVAVQSPLEVGVCHTLMREPALSLVGASQVSTSIETGVNFFMEASAQGPMPDHVRREDIAIQLAAADVLFQEVLGLTPALQMPRYQQAEFIMVILRTDQTRGGQAYDEVVRNPAVSGCHIRMALGGRVDAAHNLTPAHELFHLYQNAHMMFKQGWVHEGLARWSESLLSGEVSTGLALPTDMAALENVMQASYGAAPFWQRLFYLLDPQGEVSLPEALMGKSYHNGNQVVALERLHGGEFVPQLFASLHQAGIELAQREQWPTYGWTELEQRSLRHNPEILSAVYQAVSAYLPVEAQPDELRAFMQLVESVVE